MRETRNQANGRKPEVPAEAPQPEASQKTNQHTQKHETNSPITEATMEHGTRGFCQSRRLWLWKWNVSVQGRKGKTYLGLLFRGLVAAFGSFDSDGFGQSKRQWGSSCEVSSALMRPGSQLGPGR